MALRQGTICSVVRVRPSPGARNESRVFVINPEIAFLELILSTTKALPFPCEFFSLKIKHRLPVPQSGEAVAHAPICPGSGGHGPAARRPPQRRNRWPPQKTHCQPKGDPEHAGCSRTRPGRAAAAKPSPAPRLKDCRTRQGEAGTTTHGTAAYTWHVTF